jgi:hypothetical protein
MKPMGFSRHKYSGDLYKFVIEQIGDTEETNYYFVGKISLTASLDDNQRLIIKTDEPIQIGSLIKDIRDSDGNLILDDMTWQVSNLSPLLNAFNTLDSFRLRAVKFQGTI